MQASPNKGAYDNMLDGVSAVSSTRAWAVGHYWDGSGDRMLILHWNGTALEDSADPRANAWAVGNYLDGSGIWTLVLHWNGTSWSRQPIPNLDFAASATNELRGVTVASPTSVWAAGDYGSSPSKAFVIHCW